MEPHNNEGGGTMSSLAVKFVEELVCSREATERLTSLIQQQMQLEQEAMKARVEMHNAQMEGMEQLNNTMASWYDTMVDVAQNQGAGISEVDQIAAVVAAVMRGRQRS